MLKEYMVALKKGVDYNQVWNDIENLSPGLQHIPDRAIGIANNLDALDRITHYFLTDEEAQKLRDDPRVLGVQIPAEHRPEITITKNTVQVNNFTKTTSSSGDYVNWGLIRNSQLTNVYGTGTTTTEDYVYNVDGSNVDVVIVDSGIQANHPEFQYLGNSTSRLNQYVWYPGLNPTTYYTDVDGHGTHVAGITAGKTYGWAKNSNIYSLKYDGLTMSDIANYIIAWHNSKTINPNTGVVNPTVVNMSFGYSISLSTFNITAAYYRGSIINNPGYGPSSIYGLIFGQGRVPYWDETYNTPIVQMTDAGIVVCKSAGNDSQKIDIPGGIDWDNEVALSYASNGTSIGSFWYMRGGSPNSSTETELGDAIIVGSLDSTTFNANLDQKADYSMAGPGVNIFAAGTDIMSACSNTNLYTGQPYYWNTSFKQVNISGTSMSAPQVAGIATLYVQNNPTATPAEVKSALLTIATTTMIGNVSTNPSGNDYSNTVSQWGGNAGVAYMPYNTLYNFVASGAIEMTNVTINTE
jgi:subtilisin family serine protease